MFLAALIGLSLAMSPSVKMARFSPDGGSAQASAAMSTPQKSAALGRLIRSATECVARTVAADPRFERASAAADVTALIVDAMGSCAEPVRAMIEGHDRLYGEGSGEAFFLGPYLDALPETVARWPRDNNP